MESNDQARAIAANLARVRETIAAAAIRAGRDPTAVKLIAVSKTHPVSMLETAIAVGQTVFGENTAQEALPKIDALRDRGLEWHFIGHLQSNKAKFVPGNFRWLHSLASHKLAARLSQAAQTHRSRLQTLIEVNITRDPKKHGVSPEEVFALVEQIAAAELAGISVRGLMAIGPYPADEHQTRTAFAALRELRDACQSRFGLADFTELSMGMSNDFVPAILEGATMVRVGSAIFGDRVYTR
ncbi:MAG: YggS family pyridoxal phosphate-dependent enzyme [Gammaproteobacteria bacterium]|nr:YggS family pyridoxal phosphate-dependent enzyme [Gammaproteobacteria bacterium]